MIEEYNKSLNHFAIWLLVMTPMAKYGLMMHPLNMSCELWLQSYSFIQSFLLSSTFRKQAFNFLTKVFLTMILVYIAIVFPGFDRVMVGYTLHKPCFITCSNHFFFFFII
jgi:vesicular inhibitory amino acid transporter